MDSLRLDQFRRLLGGTALSREFYPVFPLAVLSDSMTGCLMYISQIEEPEAEMPQIAEHYNDFLNSHLGEAAMTRVQYIINGINVHYYSVQSTNNTNYKLLGETTPGKRFLIEYIIGSPVYSQLEPSVASSIASLEPL
jgi:hypothetical protein